MKPEELKKLLIRSLDSDSDPRDIAGELEREGILNDFRKGFRDKVTDSIFSTSFAINRKVEFLKEMNIVFRRIAITGIAAIIIMAISIFLMEGSLSLNTLFGLSNDYNESILCMLTGK